MSENQQLEPVKAVRGPLRRRKRKTYDDTALVEDIAHGVKTLRQIAGELGLTYNYVYCIARGLSRPDLQERIQATRRDYLSQARRLGRIHVAKLLQAHIDAGLDKDTETARKCREYLLDRFLTQRLDDDPGPPEGIQINLLDLSPETKSRVVRELGGPADDEPPRLTAEP
jgi:hypothetical protein